MNIVRIVFKKNLLFAFISFAGIGGLAGYALKPFGCRVYCDQKLSLEVMRQCKAIVERTSLRSEGAAALCELLKEVHPSVKGVRIAYKSSLVADVFIEACKPSLCLVSTLPGNREFIVCIHGEVVEKKFFSEVAVRGLPVFFIAGTDYDDKRTDVALFEAIRALDSDIFDEFVITWHSKSEIRLKSKTANIMLIADAATLHDSERREHAKRIFASGSGRYKRGMKVDVRLRDCLITAPL